MLPRNQRGNKRGFMTKGWIVIALVAGLGAGACGGGGKSAKQQQETAPLPKESQAGPGPAAAGAPLTEEECRATINHVFDLLRREQPDQADQIEAGRAQALEAAVPDCLAENDRALVDCFNRAQSVAELQRCGG